MRSRIALIVAATAIELAVCGGKAEFVIPSASPDSTTNTTDKATVSLEDYHLPEHFAQLVVDRAATDEYQARRHKVEASTLPAPTTSFAAKGRDGNFVRIIRSKPGEETLKYRTAMPSQFIPLRGFRAPILKRAAERRPAVLATNSLSELQRRAAECVTRRLAADGLLPTLAQVVGILGPASFLTNGIGGLDSLTALGFPTDLLACFPTREPADEVEVAASVLARVARRLSEGATPVSLRPELDALPFRWGRARPEFEIATEAGEHELGLLRMQAGGGYRDGILPGGSIDVICQLVAKLPNADFLLSVPDAFLPPFENLARQMWRLRKADQVTLVSEPLPVAAWAQDNGKAGLVAGPKPGEWKLATLTPRYACMDEGKSTFEPGQSFLMDGLEAAGHKVVHSALLFQGGNLLAGRDPKTGERVLLVGEGEIYRNIALGLTRAQALEAFRVEFGVDRCVVFPAVSYHLDFDVSLRARGSQMIAFVNDPLAAARTILDLSLGPLERHGTLDPRAAQGARAALAAGRDADALLPLTNAVQRLLQGRPDLPASLAQLFAGSRTDSAAGNLQCFLVALDLLESSLQRDEVGAVGIEKREYFSALRRMDTGRQRQAEELRKLGWTVVPVPSLPDFFRSINYLNGIHHRDGYIMPVFGGFYTPLDQRAMAAIRLALGPELRITQVQSAECQRGHGGVHCTAVAYPRL